MRAVSRNVSGRVRRRTPAACREKFDTDFDVLEQTINPSKLSSMTERTLSQFVKAMRERKHNGGKVGLAPHTMRSYLTSLKTALKWAHLQKLIPTMPKFPAVKVPPKKATTDTG